MKSSAPQIRFDRFIQLDWAAAALMVRAGTAGLDDLNALLDAAELGLDPWGEILDHARIAEIRECLPALAHGKL